MFRCSPSACVALATLLAGEAALAQPASEPPSAPRVEQQRPRERIEPLPPLPPLPGLDVEWPDLGATETEAAASDENADAPAEVRYRVEVEGLKEIGLDDEFQSLSALKTQEKEAVRAIAQINRRVREDEALIVRLLRSEGYYAGSVDTEIEPAENGGRAKVTIIVTPGTRYSFSSVNLEAQPGGPQMLVDELLAMPPGSFVDASDVLAAETRVLVGLPERGYPFVSLGDRDILIDHEVAKASYSNSIDTGSLSRIGDVRIVGDRLVSEDHIAMLGRFRRGDVYDSRDIEDLRRALVATGLFGSLSVRPVQNEADAGTVDLVVRSEAAPLRTLAGDIGYSTGEGLKVQGSWQHRNLLPPEGAVTFRGILGTQQQLAAAELRRSNWRQRDRTLGALVQFSHEDRKAFEATSFSLAGRIERETNLIWQKTWLWSLGAELTASDERDKSIVVDGIDPSRRTFFIAAAPTHLGYDGTDDLLDPKRGFRLSARGSPELSLQSGVFGYLKGQIDGSVYLPTMNDRLVFAARGRIGTIFGASRGRIAPSRRFYAGGGGSVRGYDYQKVGPLDVDGDPLGGRSIVEMSVEARYRFGNFGIVPFIDAGTVDTNIYPRFHDLSFGAGIGARYYTNFGPIRLDLATPINPRRGDPKVAVYVSIGQAF